MGEHVTVCFGPVSEARAAGKAAVGMVALSCLRLEFHDGTHPTPVTQSVVPEPEPLPITPVISESDTVASPNIQ